MKKEVGLPFNKNNEDVIVKKQIFMLKDVYLKISIDLFERFFLKNITLLNYEFCSEFNDHSLS